MAWYENPTIAAILGGAVGAIIAALVSLFIWKKTHKIKRIDCVINDITSLLSISETIKDKLEIKVSGTTAESVYLISLDIINNGTEAITNQPIMIRLDENAKVIDYKIETNPPVGFGEIKEEKKDGSSLDLKIDLLNPGDSINLEVLSIDNLSENIDIYLKNENVRDRVYTRKSAEKIMDSLTGEKSLFKFLSIIGFLPGFGGLSRNLMMFYLASRIDRIAKK